jgi:hypothetical protein
MTTMRNRLLQSGYRRLVGKPSDYVAALKEIEAILNFTKAEVGLALQQKYKSSDDIPGFRRAEVHLRLGAEHFDGDCIALLAELDRLRAEIVRLTAELEGLKDAQLSTSSPAMSGDQSEGG